MAKQKSVNKIWLGLEKGSILILVQSKKEAVEVLSFGHLFMMSIHIFVGASFSRINLI